MPVSNSYENLDFAPSLTVPFEKLRHFERGSPFRTKIASDVEIMPFASLALVPGHSGVLENMGHKDARPMLPTGNGRISY